MNWIFWVVIFLVIDILLMIEMATTETEGELSRYTPEQLLDKLEHKGKHWHKSQPRRTVRRL